MEAALLNESTGCWEKVAHVATAGDQGVENKHRGKAQVQHLVKILHGIQKRVTEAAVHIITPCVSFRIRDQH